MNNFWPIVVGAALAVIGGAVGDELHAWGGRRRERKAIKIAISDELSEIETTTTGIHTVWESTARVIDPKLVGDLFANTAVYDGLRTRLFLITDEDVRKELGAFYKKVKDNVRKTEGKIGALDLTADAVTEQGGFDAGFQALGTQARQLRGKLK